MTVTNHDEDDNEGRDLIRRPWILLSISTICFFVCWTKSYIYLILDDVQSKQRLNILIFPHTLWLLRKNFYFDFDGQFHWSVNAGRLVQRGLRRKSDQLISEWQAHSPLLSGTHKLSLCHSGIASLGGECCWTTGRSTQPKTNPANQPINPT